MKEVYPVEIRGGYVEDDMCVAMLYEPMTHRKVPIIVGKCEAEAIVLALEGTPTERPLTHELLSSILHTYDLTLQQVTIDRLFDGVFYATLHLDDGFSVKKIDSRASDAIVMAIREEVAVMMDESVINEAGFPAGNLEAEDMGRHEPTIEELEAQLRRCEANEDYEQAAILLEKINALKK